MFCLLLSSFEKKKPLNGKMEENAAKLMEEQLLNLNHLQELFQKTPKQDGWDDEIPPKCPQNLTEEESLRTYLDKLKKENFALRTSIKAWQTTLETKLEEYKAAELKLEELHNEIWSERERFCSRLEKFNEEYGILSSWWETQVRFVTELESKEGKAWEDEKEIQNLEKEIGELKEQIEQLQARKQEVQKTPDTAEEHSISSTQNKTENPKQVTKKVKFSEVVKEHNIAKTGEPPENDLYSVVDLEKVKIAKRRRKNNFSCKDKKILQIPQN